MKKKLETISIVGGLIVGSVAMGVGMYYNLPLVTGAGLLINSYPAGMTMRKMVESADEEYKKEHEILQGKSS